MGEGTDFIRMRLDKGFSRPFFIPEESGNQLSLKYEFTDNIPQQQ
jgi:hypothetical protein